MATIDKDVNRQRIMTKCPREGTVKEWEAVAQVAERIFIVVDKNRYGITRNGVPPVDWITAAEVATLKKLPANPDDCRKRTMAEAKAEGLSDRDIKNLVSWGLILKDKTPAQQIPPGGDKPKDSIPGAETVTEAPNTHTAAPETTTIPDAPGLAEAGQGIETGSK